MAAPLLLKDAVLTSVLSDLAAATASLAGVLRSQAKLMLPAVCIVAIDPYTSALGVPLPSTFHPVCHGPRANHKARG